MLQLHLTDGSYSCNFWTFRVHHKTSHCETIYDSSISELVIIMALYMSGMPYTSIKLIVRDGNKSCITLMQSSRHDHFHPLKLGGHHDANFVITGSMPLKPESRHYDNSWNCCHWDGQIILLILTKGIQLSCESNSMHPVMMRHPSIPLPYKLFRRKSVCNAKLYQTFS